jgi:hypothetical protein
VAGERPAQKNPVCRRQEIGGAPAQRPHGLVGGKAVAAVQDGHRAAQGQLGGQRRDLLPRRGRRADDDHFVGFEEGGKVHATKIAVFRSKENSPVARLAGEGSG